MVSLTTIFKISAEERELRISPAMRPSRIRGIRLLFMADEVPSIFLLLFAARDRHFFSLAFSGSHGRRPAPAGKVGASSDETGATLISEIRPCPLNKDQHAVAETDQKKDVDEQPGQPGHEARDVNLAELGDSSGATDGGEAAFVAVVKRRARLNSLDKFSPNEFGDEAALLNGDGRDARQHLAGCVFQGGEVSDNEDFGMAGKTEIGINQHASGGVCGQAELLTERRSGHSRGPENNCCLHRRVAHINYSGLN